MAEMLKGSIVELVVLLYFKDIKHSRQGCEESEIQSSLFRELA